MARAGVRRNHENEDVKVTEGENETILGRKILSPMKTFVPQRRITEPNTLVNEPMTQKTDELFIIFQHHLYVNLFDSLSFLSDNFIKYLPIISTIFYEQFKFKYRIKACLCLSFKLWTKINL